MPDLAWLQLDQLPQHRERQLIFTLEDRRVGQRVERLNQVLMIVGARIDESQSFEGAEVVGILRNHFAQQRDGLRFLAAVVQNLDHPVELQERAIRVPVTFEEEGQIEQVLEASR